MSSINFTMPAVSVMERGLISKVEMLIVEDTFAILWIVISLSGMITNTINIRTFIAMGPTDGVTVTFLALSISDVLGSVTSFTLGLASVFTMVETKHEFIFLIQPFAIKLFSANISLMLYGISSFITLFLAVVRCMCVAKPLQFKNVLTRSRSFAAILFFIVFSLAFYIPLLSQTGTERGFDTSVNKTRTVLWLSDIREEVKDVVAFVIETVISIVIQVVIIVCVVIMADCLRKSGEFRLSLSTSTGIGDVKKSSAKLPAKELKVVRQVVLISTIYIICTLPKTFSAFYSLVAPDFDVGKRQHNLYLTLSYLQNTTELINSASTFPIYYMYNSKFKSLCFSKGNASTK